MCFPPTDCIASRLFQYKIHRALRDPKEAYLPTFCTHANHPPTACNSWSSVVFRPQACSSWSPFSTSDGSPTRLTEWNRSASQRCRYRRLADEWTSFSGDPPVWSTTAGQPQAHRHQFRGRSNRWAYCISYRPTVCTNPVNEKLN